MTAPKVAIAGGLSALLLGVVVASRLSSPESTTVTAKAIEPEASEERLREAPASARVKSDSSAHMASAIAATPTTPPPPTLPLPTTPDEVDSMLHRFHANLPSSRFFGVVDGVLLGESENTDGWAAGIESALRKLVASRKNVAWSELICRQGICKASFSVQAGRPQYDAYTDFTDGLIKLVKEGLPAECHGMGMHDGGFHYYLFNTDPSAGYIKAMHEELAPDLLATEKK